MRDWSSGAKPSDEQPARELTELPPELLQPFDWEEVDTTVPEAPLEAVAVDLTPATDDFQQAREDEEERAPAPDLFRRSRDEVEGRAPAGDLFGFGQSDDEARPEALPLAIVEQSALDPGGWDTFAAKIAPAMPRSESEKKSPRFGRLFGRAPERKDDAGSEWSVDPAAISEVKNAGSDSKRGPSMDNSVPASLAGWEPIEASAEEPEPRGIDADEGAELGAAQRRSNKPGPGAWGAPPSDEDGSLKYELPRRFTDRDVWDDEWFERPPGDDRVPVRPPQVLREEAPAALIAEPDAAAEAEHTDLTELSEESIEETWRGHM